MAEMDCGTVEKLLPDFLEGELSDGERSAIEAHAELCSRCGPLIADIERITREAAALAPLAPARDLWSGIEARISAPVIPLAAPERAPARWFGGWMAAAAAALVISTAGVTYLATARTLRSAPAATVALAPVAMTGPTEETPTPAAIPEGAENGTAAEPQGRVAATVPSGSRPGPASSGGQARNASVTTGEMDAAYGREIDVLQRIVRDNRSTLDPATVRVIDRNLAVIDSAIVQSKAALARDPASRLLYDQINSMLGRKVELLRTMARLSSTT